MQTDLSGCVFVYIPRTSNKKWFAKMKMLFFYIPLSSMKVIPLIVVRKTEHSTIQHDKEYFITIPLRIRH